MVQLYQNLHKLTDILKEKSGGGGGAAGRKGRPGTSSGGGGAAAKNKSYLSIKFVALIIKALVR